ncbi:T9SS type A sorting domain-containing protein [Ohtaekwangia koreensis]|uniref:Por secretion system C-terminal sorting domain-containing protein n=1 Tax=Ohtaekwangia koreensis TaxID=688867 RepID=A0A1T5M0N1_9BACT|nr:hypothetical protein [Ohtaekwangia koreensis]SKC81801.1 hypothetical protein SAMN05660236_4021 [Ohtaekwangia koreensis]
MKTYSSFSMIILLVITCSTEVLSQTEFGDVSSGSANLELCLDSKRLNSDGSNPTLRSTVSTWYDKSGNGVNVTQNIANVATYSSGGMTFNSNGYYSDTSYYRLKQIDFDGKVDCSTVGNVILTSHRNDNNLILDQIHVLSAEGIAVNDKVVIKILSASQLEVDLSALPSGLYLIKTKTGSLTVEKK